MNRSQEAESSGFWDGVVPPSAFAAHVEKYRAIDALLALPAGEAQRRALRDTARRFPGSLREAQLVEPSRLRRRAASAIRASQEPGRPRSDWRHDPETGALVLWSELHAMLADQLRWRAVGSAGRRVGLADFLVFVAPTDRWPPRVPSSLGNPGGPLRSRHAYMWLAARAGLTVDALDACLFGVGLAARRRGLASSK